MAVRTTTQFKTLYGTSGTQFPDNTTAEISEADIRAFGEDIADSFLNESDDPYTSPFPQVTASGTDTYAATLSPAITAYATGQKFQIKFTNASTGVSTLNLNAVGAKKIYTNPTTQATTGDIVANQIYLLAYDAALDSASGGFQMLGSGGGGGGGGAVDAGDVAFTPAGNISATDVQAALEELDAEKVSPVGVQDLYVPASAMWPRVTSGCSVLTQYEMATSLFNLQGLEFSDTTQQFAQFQIVMPRKWNNSTITAVVYWKPLSSGSGTVQWGVSAGAYSNDDALTVALGTPQTVDDTFIATDDLHITSATSAITVAGTPADADFLALQISRNPASDTLDVNAILLGVSIRVTVDAATDA